MPASLRPQRGKSPSEATCQDNLVQITVADTGRGIEPNRLETVFDRFYQEEGALRRTAGGTGLGLAICRQIVTGMGGKIWATSIGKDQGSQFHFTLPMVTSQTNIRPQRQSTPVASASSRRSRRSAVAD